MQNLRVELTVSVSISPVAFNVLGRRVDLTELSHLSSDNIAKRRECLVQECQPPAALTSMRAFFWVTFDLRSSREKGVVPPKRAKAVFHLNIKVLQHQLVTATKGKGIE
jgi:hypothetical protein